VIGFLTLVVVGVPLLALGAVDAGLGLNRRGFAYILLDAVIFVIATQTYFAALRRGRVTVVSPIAATDPLWTALFAVALVGASLSLPVVLGIVVATVGVVLFGRFLEHDPEPLGDVLPPPAVSVGASAQNGAIEGLQVVVLSLVTAACWGVGPVLIELAIGANGSLTFTMIVLGQGLAAATLVPVLLVRRRPVLISGLSPARRRRGVTLLLAVGLIEAVYETVLFMIVDQIGSVLMVLILATSPLWSLAFAMLLLKERPGRRLGLAAAVTLCGVFVATLASVLG
jgi:drug/metabolite transporter (DMT)-like permease